MPANRNAIVIVVDRLGADSLGPYGNTSVETPGHNRLAAESLLFENMLTDSTDLQQVYRSYLQGTHAFSNDSDRSSLAALLEARGIDRIMVSDDEEVLDHHEASRFRQRIEVPLEAKRAERDGETQFARLFGHTTGILEELSSPFLLWIHSSGMTGSWDAPLDRRRVLSDEDELDPAEFIEPPEIHLADDYDPDDLLLIAQAYAAQVQVLDYCLDAFLNHLSESPNWDQTLVAFTSPRGYPLGEHLVVGSHDAPLHNELLHVPMLLRLPAPEFAMRRSHRLCQPGDLFETLINWLDVRGGDPPRSRFESVDLIDLASNRSPVTRDRLCAADRDEKAIRTRGWFLREHAEHSALFVKPDDKWEVNDVSGRREDIVQQMCLALKQFDQGMKQGDFESISALTESLIDPVL